MVLLPQNSLVPGEISAECQARFGRRVVASDSLQIERRARHQQPVNQRTQNSWGTHTQHLAQSQHSLAQPQRWRVTSLAAEPADAPPFRKDNMYICY